MTPAGGIGGGTAEPPCRAPWTAWHFDPYGWVTACTANKRDALGHVATSTLAEIWRGPAAEALRATLAAGGLGSGCDLCAWQQGQSGHDAMYARLYDHLPIDAAATGPSHLEFALSTACNLRCVMCNGSHSSSIRTRREGLGHLTSPYGDPFFAELDTLLDGVRSTKFLGGEPFLAAENFRVWELFASRADPPACHVTTNGTVWNDRVARILDQVPMSFAVSVDGHRAETVEAIRVGADHRELWRNIERFEAHVAAHGTDLSLTFCLMTANWRELLDFLAAADERDVPVFVNTVITPFRYSLYRLPKPDLAEVVAALEAATPEAERRLGRNLTTWQDHVGRLRDALAAAPEPEESPVHLPALAPHTTPAPDPLPTLAESSVRLDRWAGARCAVLTIDVESRIAAVDPGDQAEPHYDRMIGLGTDELFVWLQSAFGRPDRADHVVQAAHHGERHLWFCRADRTTEVRVIGTADGAGGAWWLVAARPYADHPGTVTPVEPRVAAAR